MHPHAPLDRFLAAQEQDYPRALAEIRQGRKTSHWMWYIFPQLRGLGHSALADRYGIQDLAEARAYLRHPVLRARLEEISTALLKLPKKDAHTIFGSPDDLKLRSSMTLFAVAAGPPSLFRDVLEQYFEGAEDPKTLQLLRTVS